MKILIFSVLLCFIKFDIWISELVAHKLLAPNVIINRIVIPYFIAILFLLCCFYFISFKTILLVKELKINYNSCNCHKAWGTSPWTSLSEFISIFFFFCFFSLFFFFFIIIFSRTITEMHESYGYSTTLKRCYLFSYIRSVPSFILLQTTPTICTQLTKYYPFFFLLNRITLYFIFWCRQMDLEQSHPLFFPVIANIIVSYIWNGV